MDNPRPGYRSIYWRIRIGFVICVAAVLAIQGTVLLFLMNREDPDARTSFTTGVSRRLGDALQANPDLDIESFVRTEYPTFPRPFYIITTSGAAFYFGGRRPNQLAVNTVIEEFGRHKPSIPEQWEESPYWASSIVVDGVLTGLVAVVPRDFVAQLWRPMALLATGLLITGTVLASWFIFGPANKRLRSLETTAQRLGSGDLDARAEEAGGDEVASLARTFNVMARELAARSAQIGELDRTRRLLLADISHELMTPLTAIRGYQEKLVADRIVGESRERRQYVEIIGEEALRVERIVRDLLVLAKFEGTDQILDLEVVSIEGLFGRVAARHEAEAVSRRIQLRTTIAPGAELVRGDKFRLEQAIQNLAANALRHVADGGRVELRASLAGGDTIITVTDTGAGIAAKHLPFVFDRFYKVDSSRAAGPEGSGLGLSIVKAIIERHGGTVAVASQPGVETVFTIRLPGSLETVRLDRPA